VRAVLLDALNTFERQLTHRQAYLKNDQRSVSDKRARLARNIRRKRPTLPNRLAQSLMFMGTAIHGLADEKSGEDDLVRRIQPFLSITAIRERLIHLDAETLAERYEEAGRMLPRMMPPLLVVTKILLLPFFMQRLQDARNSSARLPENLDP